MYIVIPANHATNWDTILDYAWEILGISGNEFIGSLQYNASSGKIVFKLAI